MTGSELDQQVITTTSMEVDDKTVRKASLTVCDPARRLTRFEASEVLKALGLMYDPLHTELALPYGSRRKR
jgi:hypothetical protein